jgi:acyl-CoA thioesterase
MPSLTEILASTEYKSDVYCATAGEDWLQGRTLFGGLIAALAGVAMRKHIPAERLLRALQIVYVGPNAPGTVEFEPKILRAGKAVTLASCAVRSAGEVTATVTATYGIARESVLNIAPQATTLAVSPDQVPDVANRPSHLGFVQHYQQRWARGAFPFSRAHDSRMSVYLLYCDETVQKITATHALALMDAIPTPALALMDKPGPASTLSWTLEILDHRFDFATDQWWRLDAEVDAARDGYVVHSGHVVNPAGQIAAISRQVVVVYG